MSVGLTQETPKTEINLAVWKFPFIYIYIYIIVYILCHMFVFEVYTKRMQKNYSWTKEAISMNCIYAYINIIIIHLYKGRKWLGGNSWLIGFLYVSWPSYSWASRLIRFATYIEKKKKCTLYRKQNLFYYNLQELHTNI